MLIVGGSLPSRSFRPPAGRMVRVRQYWQDPGAHSAWSLQAGVQCGDAPFVAPTDGYVGFLWGDSFRPGRRHQGLDLFGPSGPYGLGETRVVAVYDGYLTRLPDWRSAVIVRIPHDPLQPDRQIWTYYTHMAAPEGNSFIDPAFPTGMHLHFSIVQDDGKGGFKSALEIRTLLGPSLYLAFEVNAGNVGDSIAV